LCLGTLSLQGIVLRARNARGADGLKAAIDLFRKSTGDTLDYWFDSDPIKAVLGFDSVVGNLASPYTPGSGYVVLHHVLG
jgi:phytoene dehydrogenase-like protein